MLLLCITTTDCTLINTQSLIDSYRDDQGNTIIADTPRMWSYFISDVDHLIEAELLNKPLRASPPGSTYEDEWLRSHHQIIIGRENPEKYIHHIIQRRREEGLPEINWPKKEELH